MGDPVSLGLVFGAGQSIAGGMAAKSEASAAKQDAEINSYIGRTRAIQTDTDARLGLGEELSSMRAVLAANGQRANVGTLEVMKELRRVRSRERAVAYGNQMQGSYDYARQGRNAETAGRLGLMRGFIGAGPSLFDLYQYNRG